MSSQNNNYEQCYANYENCKPCQINYLKENFTFRTSGNEKIDEFIQEMQFNINNYWTVVFEWIPYNKLHDIKEIGKGDHAAAIWKDGPLCYDYKNQRGWARELDKKVALKKCLYNSQDIINEVLNEAKKFKSFKDNLSIYGISQIPDTKVYIMVIQHNHCEKCGEHITSELCKPCQIYSLKYFVTNSGNEKIDDFVQEMQVDITFEWIPYNQFNDIKEIGKGGLATAMWKDGPLNYDNENKEYTRESDIKVALKCLQNITVEEFLNEVKEYSTNNQIYGISQNPYTEDYIMVLQFNHCEICGEYGCKTCQIIVSLNKNTTWISENEEMDDFIQEMQLKINRWTTLFEWIPYDQFYNIKKIGESNFAAAIWEDGPLCYNINQKEWTRNLDETVALKYLHNYNLQDVINELLNEAEKIKSFKDLYNIYGISQNPDTKDYLMVLQFSSHCEKCGERYDDGILFNWCKPCQINDLKKHFKNWTSGNDKIDNFIQEMQVNVNEYQSLFPIIVITFEWISYNQFYDIKEIGNDGYSAIWKDGPLSYDKNKYTRKPDIKVVLKYLYNLQNINEFANKILNNKKLISILGIYGMSQNPDTKDYILIFKYNHCEKCGEQYGTHKWCKPCQIDSLKNNFTNWTGGNKKIDDFIQQIQLQIDHYDDIVVEWIPYDQLNDIKEIGKNEFITVYSAIWKNGPLYFNGDDKEYTRKSDIKVALKCLKNITEEFLNEEEYSIKHSIFDENNYICKSLKLYGISQNPNTKDFTMVLDYVEHKNYKIQCEKCSKQYVCLLFAKKKWCLLCQRNYLNTNKTSGNKKIDDLIRKIQFSIDYATDVIFEWIPYSQFKDIKEIGNGGFATVYSAIWEDGPLCYYDISVDNSIEYKRQSNEKVALKCLYNSQNITNEFLNEVNAYSLENNIFRNRITFNEASTLGSVSETVFKRDEEYILKIYGISQNPETNDYIMVFDYAEGGNLTDWMNKNYINFEWKDKIRTLHNIINGLKKIHQKKIVHRDFHTGNILIKSIHGRQGYGAYISDMGLCGEVNNVDKSKIYGVIPYVAPEVLRGNPYTQIADIYSFGMIMYYVATGRQSFSNYAHDELLVLNICNGIIPEINELEAPKCYIDLMKQCWDQNPHNRPNAIEIFELIELFYNSYMYDDESEDCQSDRMMGMDVNYEFGEQFKEAEEYRKTNLSSIENNQLTNHPKAIYISRLLNPFTKELPKYDNIDNNSVEITDFTEFN